MAQAQLSFFGGPEGEAALNQMQASGSSSVPELLKTAQWSVLVNHTGVYGVLKAGPIQFTGGILWEQLFSQLKEAANGGK